MSTTAKQATDNRWEDAKRFFLSLAACVWLLREVIQRVTDLYLCEPRLSD